MRLIPILLTSIFLTACTGGGDSSSVSTTTGSGGGQSSTAGPQIDVFINSDTPVPDITGPSVGSGGGSGAGGGGGGSGGGFAASDFSASLAPSSSSGSATYSFASLSGSSTGGTIGLRTMLTLSNTTSFQIMSVLGGAALRTRQLRSPADDLLYDFASGETLTTGQFFNFEVNVAPYPTRGLDPAIVDGGTYTHLLEATQGLANIDGAIIAKNDPNLGSGTLRINFFLCGSEAQSGATRAAINSAIVILESIYASVGITVDYEIIEVTLDSGVVPFPLYPSTFYEDQTSSLDSNRQFAVNVFLAEDISADNTTNPGNPVDSGSLGFAAAIPGPALPSSRSAVAISLSENAGTDGAFTNPSEIGLLAETMAHEAGHYLGLFHPAGVVDGVLVYDPLADTPECGSISDCLSDLGNNLMFYSAVRLPDGSYLEQRSLTADQGEVLNLQVLVN